MSRRDKSILVRITLKDNAMLPEITEEEAFEVALAMEVNQNSKARRVHMQIQGRLR